MYWSQSVMKIPRTSNGAKSCLVWCGGLEGGWAGSNKRKIKNQESWWRQFFLEKLLSAARTKDRQAKKCALIRWFSLMSSWADSYCTVSLLRSSRCPRVFRLSFAICVRFSQSPLGCWKASVSHFCLAALGKSILLIGSALWQGKDPDED